MFTQTFYGCNKLSGYIPANTFAKMDSAGFDSATMSQIFYSTALAMTCPSGTYQYITGFESAWDGKVACTPCPESHPNSVAGSTSQNKCYTSCTTACAEPKCPDNATCSYGNETNSGNLYYGTNSCDATAPTCSITFTCNENFEKVDGACKLIPEFTIETTNMSVGSTFSFDISASGTFYVDCGDGGTLTGTGVSGNTITRNDTTNAQYKCTYPNSGTHKILFAGEATGYNGTNAAISFEENANIVSLGGSLGAIFGGSANNMFNSAFYKSTSLETIPETLFEGVTGSAKNMFRSVFNGCTLLKSIPSGLFAGVFDGAENMFYLSFANCALLESIPDGLFAGITTGAERMFHGTFYGCSLLNNLPSDLFGGLNGTNAQYLFSYTFQDCSSLESIPSGLFNGVSGNAPYMFEGTFQNNTLLRAIESDLFANVSGGAEMMFHGTFYGCKSLESIPKNLFAGITESASNMFKETFMGCTSLQTIPENLFEGITTGAEKMFLSTFDACSGLVSLPSGLFRNITGKPAIDMFDYTFYDCSGLTGYIPSNMFEKMDSTGFEKTSMTRIFYNTPNLATTCPAGTTQDITGFESAWDGHVACTPCPESHPNSVEGATSQNQCYTSCTTQCVQPTCPDNAQCSYGNESASGNSYYGTDSCDATAPTCSMEFVCNDGYQKNDAGNACVIVEYDIIYELNGGVNSESNPVKYNVETDTLTLLAPKRSGYSFVGWYDNAEFAGEPVTQIIRASTNHKSFYAKWNECAIGYYCLDGVKTKCPDGFTSKIGADSADDCNIKLKKLHIGKDTLYLTPNKPDVSPLMAFGIGDEVYYGGLSEIEQTLHDNATTKYNVLMDGKQRYLYDLTAD